MTMTFKGITDDTNCNCLKDAEIDLTSTFAIKTNKETLRPTDFKTKWEKGDKPVGDCKKICSKKGVSLSIYNEEEKQEVIRIFKKLFPLSPQYKPYIIALKFYNEAGMIKRSPSNQNHFHCDFYKSDNFDSQGVTIIDSTSMSDV